MPAPSAHDHTLPLPDGGALRLADFAGKPVLLVNVASQCGYTPQYAGLEALWRRLKPRGLVVLGVPSNDFGAQEPGTDAEIGAFCRRTYDVTFPLAAKQRVIGPAAHPLYRWIAAELGEDMAPKWNFHKYLFGPKGGIDGAWPSRVAPEDRAILDATTPFLSR
jgi:glutathione peroxidase